jgi:hypothetical protein
VVGENASAGLYSLIETFRADGIAAYRYLIPVQGAATDQSVEDYEALLPSRFKTE